MGSRDVLSEALINPFADHALSVDTCEGTCVGDASAREEHVTDELLDFNLNVLYCLLPSDSLVNKQYD